MARALDFATSLFINKDGLAKKLKKFSQVPEAPRLPPGPALWRKPRSTPLRDLCASVLRLLCCRGRRKKGEISGVTFPVCLDDLLGAEGPSMMTYVLRLGRHLKEGQSVTSVTRRDVDIRDGVKGDKCVIDVSYTGKDIPNLATSFFIKFNVAKLSAMRLLMETTEVQRCECFFYRYVSRFFSEPKPVQHPKCYYVDYNLETGEFVVILEYIKFGKGDVLPMKHRIRDKTTLEEQRLLVEAGATLNSHFFGGLNPAICGLHRFDATHRQMWALTQLMARWTLHHTTRKTNWGRKVNEAFMTWNPPAELVGREAELIRDMPGILTSLCNDESMIAYGHNDITADNAYFTRDGKALKVGFFDWQQSCVNNVGQEWAWNLHFLEPDFLDAHESELIDLVLQTYEQNGHKCSRDKFLNAYVLGTVQMYVFGGASLQLLLRSLDRQGLLASLCPEDPRCCDTTMDKDTQEKIVGAEMTRRTFTNVCRIMHRHNFVAAYQKWQQEHGLAPALPEAPAPSSAGVGAEAEGGGDATGVRRRLAAKPE